eukprot:764998-Hanusia_phi.AAC.7
MRVDDGGGAGRGAGGGGGGIETGGSGGLRKREERTSSIERAMMGDAEVWAIKRRVKEELVRRMTSNHGNGPKGMAAIAAEVEGILEETGMGIRLKNLIYNLHRNAARPPPCSFPGLSPSETYVADKLDFVERAKLKWEKRIRQELDAMAAELDVPLQRVHKDEPPKLPTDDQAIRFVYDDNDLLDVVLHKSLAFLLFPLPLLIILPSFLSIVLCLPLMYFQLSNIVNPNHQPMGIKNSIPDWGLIKVELEVPQALQSSPLSLSSLPLSVRPSVRPSPSPSLYLSPSSPSPLSPSPLTFLQVKDLDQTREVFKELDPSTGRHLGVDDEQRPQLLEERVKAIKRALEIGYIPMLRNLAKRGIPQALRPAVWKNILNVTVR